MTAADYRHGTGLSSSHKLDFPLSLADVATPDTPVCRVIPALRLRGKAGNANSRIRGKHRGPTGPGAL